MSTTDRDDFVQDPTRQWRMAGAEGPGKESARVNSRASGDGCAEAGLAPQPQLDPWLLLAGVPQPNDRGRLFDRELARLFPEKHA